MQQTDIKTNFPITLSIIILIKMGNIFKPLWTKLSNKKSKKQHRILFMGLDAAGKTTILYKLKLGKVVNAIPTISFNVEEISHNNITFNIFDLGGGDMIRTRLHPHYYPGTTGLVFVVDSSARDRIDFVREEM